MINKLSNHIDRNEDRLKQTGKVIEDTIRNIGKANTP
jgi:hypothetical protein